MGKRYLVTGGAGFIGSAMIKKLIKDPGNIIANVDKLTYASNLESLLSLKDNDSYSFFNCDICDFNKLKEIIINFRPEIIINFAADSHVDRSIFASKEFINSNIYGTYNLLEICRELCEKKEIIFHHISTDEVFGDLEESNSFFTEETPYAPSSPYSASKASSDHLVRAWHETFGLPIVLTNCSNNYGPFQFPEKLIPLVILNALMGKPLPIYGDGENIRDWLYVEDHADALLLVLEQGAVGRSYNIGGENERTNLELVKTLCAILDRLSPRDRGSYTELITFVTDRPGHDARYAIDPARIRDELGWRPSVTVEGGLEKTVQWYLDNEDWWRPLLNRSGFGQRLGTKP